MIHFCFGNGNSRKELDVDKFKKHGTVIGCNAIYRDFTPDILVALDSRINHESQVQDMHLKIYVILVTGLQYHLMWLLIC